MSELTDLINIDVNIKYELSSEHIFVIGAWVDSIEKEKILVRCIKKLREFNIQILLVTHCEICAEIVALVDFFIFDDKNELLYFNDIKRLNINSLRYIQTNSYTINSYVDFHHDFAVLTNIRNAFNFCFENKKAKIHYLEYDNIIDSYQYYQTFLRDIDNYDYVLYEYDIGSVSQGYCAAYMFSIKSDIASKMLPDITTLENHFMKPDWRLENYLLNSIKKYTNNIKISNYIDNDKTINMCYIWNRQILKDFIFYIVANDNNLYISFSSKYKYLIEIKYEGYQKFKHIYGYDLIPIGKYNIGGKIILKYMGSTIFEKILIEPIELFIEKNKVIF